MESNVVDKATEIKKKILAFIEQNGPSLPVAIAREVGINSLFSSAFLSELLEDGQIRISKMKVGGSPLYFLPHQVSMLENFSRYLNAKERESLSLIKEKQILKDTEQEPSIRVALRGMKDFAFPLIIGESENKELYWRYFLLNESEAKSRLYEKIKPQPPQTIPHVTMKITPSKTAETKKPDIFDNTKLPIKEQAKPKITKEPKPDSFLDEVKTFLTKNKIELIGIDKFDKKEVTGKIKFEGKNVLLVAINKKRLSDSDLLKAHKKTNLLNVPYIILTKGDLPKKLKETIDAFKNLEKIEKLEQVSKTL